MEGIIEINQKIDIAELAKASGIDEIRNDLMADTIRTMERDRKWLGDLYQFVG